MNEVAKVILLLRKHLIEHPPFGLHFEDEFDINGTICDRVAHALKKQFPSAELWDIYSARLGYAHTVTKVGDKFYDIVDKDGVSNWEDLAYVEERESKGYGKFHIKKHFE